VHWAQAALIHHGVQAQNFARFALGNDLEWPAAHFAIRREPLEWQRRVNYHLELLAAKWALDVFRNFHIPI
jgi:hypothetical protein